MNYNTKRQIQYDYLRCISCLSVVILHVSSMYLKVDFRSIIADLDFRWASFWRVVTNFAVPSFVMLSGAFLINEKNINYRCFYLKMYKRIIVPTIIFSIFYVLMHYGEIFIYNIFMNQGIVSVDMEENMLEPLVNWLKGEPNATMWYMYMVVGLYMLVPVLIRIKQSITFQAYSGFAVCMLFYGILIAYTCKLSWILLYAQWIGYFLLGNVIYELFQKHFIEVKHRKIVAIGFIGLSYCLCILYWFIFSFGKSTIIVPGSFSLVVVLGTVLQFIGVAMVSGLKNDKGINFISKYSLDVYLLHPLICEMIMQLCGRVLKQFLPGVMIPVIAIFITIFCCYVAKMYTYLIQRCKICLFVNIKGKRGA